MCGIDSGSTHSGTLTWHLFTALGKSKKRDLTLSHIYFSHSGKQLFWQILRELLQRTWTLPWTFHLSIQILQ